MRTCVHACARVCVRVWWRRQREGGVVASTMMAIDFDDQ